MDVYSLAERLRDPDPRVRVEALRILAMVEETRALAAIRWVYLNDPEQGVRAVAEWAGRLIWQAHRRGHSTQRALEEMFNRPLSPEREEQFLAALHFDMTRVGSRAARRFWTEEEYERRMSEALSIQPEVPKTVEDEIPDESVLALPGPEMIPAPPSPSRPFEDLDDLLDAGLTYLKPEPDK